MHWQGLETQIRVLSTNYGSQPMIQSDDSIQFRGILMRLQGLDLHTFMYYISVQHSQANYLKNEKHKLSWGIGWGGL